MPKIEKLTYLVNPQVAVVPGSKSTGAITPTVVDLTGGYDRAAHFIQVGSFGTNASFDAEITECATSGGTYTIIAGSGMTAITASAANKVVVIDVPVNTSKPYQKVRATATTAAINVSALAVGYNGTRNLGKTVDDAAQEIFV